MNYDKRREEIMDILRGSDAYVNAAQLAKRFGVTRQIIVSDIAILRAQGHSIISTRKGYSLDGNITDQSLRTIVCKHSNERIADEFYAVVDNGGSVVSVSVDHPLYGDLSAPLSISSRYEANEHIKKASEVGAALLSDLTDGLHVHTLRVPDEATFERIKGELSQLGILVE